MNLKKILPLVIALVLGLVAARMVIAIIRQQAAVQKNSGPKLTQVVVAKRDISPGESLGDDNIATSQIVADSAPDKTFGELTDANGRVAITSIVRGQAIIEPLLAPKGSASGLQAAIPQGMRAVTIDVNETTGVAGYVTAGSKVDIIQTLRDVINNSLVSRCLAQDVLVTAVGEHTIGNTPDSGPAHSVTLLVTPWQAELVELSSANGRPRLALRNSDDNVTTDIAAVSLAELMGEKRVKAATTQESLTVNHAADPFAPSTQPALAQAMLVKNWPVRVIAAGEVSITNLQLPEAVDRSAATDTQTIAP